MPRDKSMQGEKKTWLKVSEDYATSTILERKKLVSQSTQ